MAVKSGVKTAQKFVEARFHERVKVVVYRFYYEQGLSLIDTAREIGPVNWSTVQNWMDEWGWPRRHFGEELVWPPKPEEAVPSD